VGQKEDDGGGAFGPGPEGRWRPGVDSEEAGQRARILLAGADAWYRGRKGREADEGDRLEAGMALGLRDLSRWAAAEGRLAARRAARELSRVVDRALAVFGSGGGTS